MPNESGNQAARFKQVEALFEVAQGQPADQRAKFLLDRCPNDPELRAEVESLLKADSDSHLIDGSPLSSIAERAPALKPGDKLGNFEIVSMIGRGGMGEVYRARDLRLKREVAIKTLPPGFSGDRDRIARFEREARAASGLNHPNIVSVFDIGSEDSVSYIVSELVDGDTLAKLIERGPLPLRKLIEISTRICDGLAAAHAAGVIHRDLKPGNIMVTRDGRVKILDFGLARQDRAPGVDSTTIEVSHPGMIMGTPGYMSPEQVRGEPTDARCDLFSLGLVLYEMASGQRAFRGSSSIEVMNSILKDDTPELPAASPPALDRITRRCMEKEPSRRFQSAADLGFALNSLPVMQEAAAPGRLNRRRWLEWLAVAAVCLLVAVGFDYWRRSRSGLQSWAVSDVTVRRLTNDGGLTTDGTISADGKLLAYASDRAGAGNASSNLDIWVQQVDGNGALRITDDPANDYDPAFSPDGSQVAFRSDRQGGGIYVAPAIGGQARLLVPQGRRPRFSPDGRAILYFTGPSAGNDIRGMRTSKLFVQPLPEGTATQIGAECALFPGSAVWSPDSKRILFAGTCGNGGTSTWISGLDGTAPKSNPALFDLWRTPFRPPIIDQWIANPSRLLLPLERGGSTLIVTLPLTADGAQVTGPVGRLTFGTGNEAHASAALNGSILLSAKTEENHVWGLAIDGKGAAIGQPRQLTRGPEGEMRPAFSRDGRHLAFGARRRIYCRDLSTGEEREIPSAGYWAVSPVFSPDGMQIIFANYPNPAKIYENFFSLIPVSGGFAKKIWSLGPAAYSGWPTDWSPDGKTLLFQHLAAEYRQGFYQLDLESSTKTAFLEDPQLSLGDAHFSNDGRWVAFVGSNEDGTSAFVAPFRKGLVPRGEWIGVAAGGREGSPHFSHDDKLTFFTSERDGFRCIWVQRLGSDMHPEGAPFAVYHLHQPRRSLGGLTVGPSRIAFDLAERTGDIWIMEPAKGAAK